VTGPRSCVRDLEILAGLVKVSLELAAPIGEHALVGPPRLEICCPNARKTRDMFYIVGRQDPSDGEGTGRVTSRDLPRPTNSFVLSINRVWESFIVSRGLKGDVSPVVLGDESIFNPLA
jgi:hypothetical protein